MSDIDRERAIELIELMMREYEENECMVCEITFGDEEFEALRFARDSLKVDEAYQLEYESTTKNDLGVDCVARQDIERYIEGFINEYTPKEELEFINLELDGLKHLPSVTPQEPRKGHWITKPHVYGATYCSECDFELKIDDTNYCPNCGADMREVEE